MTENREALPRLSETSAPHVGLPGAEMRGQGGSYQPDPEPRARRSSSVPPDHVPPRESSIPGVAERRLPDPAKRTLRCGPWTEREDGSMVCEKCGDVETRGGGPLGF